MDNPARAYVENGILNLLCNIMISKRPRSKTGGIVPRIDGSPELGEGVDGKRKSKFVVAI